MVEGAAKGMEAAVVSKTALDKRGGGKSHTEDCRHFQYKGDVEGLAQLARKKKCARRDESVVVVAPMEVDVNVVFADAVSKSISIAKERSDIERDAERPLLLRHCSSHATGAIDIVGQLSLNVVIKPFKMLANVSTELANHVSNEATSNSARSHDSVVSCSGVKDAGLLTIRAHIQELQTENKDLLPLRAKEPEDPDGSAVGAVC